MGFLTTFTIYNDDVDCIKNNPRGFGNSIYDACTNPSLNYRSNVFNGIVIPQKSRHSSDETIYVHAGNTVVEMNPYSDLTNDIMEKSPKFYEDMLIMMERNIKLMRKNLDEHKKKLK